MLARASVLVDAPRGIVLAAALLAVERRVERERAWTSTHEPRPREGPIARPRTGAFVDSPAMTSDFEARGAEFRALIRTRLERVRSGMAGEEFERLVADVVRTAEQFAAIEQ
jgi:hypothetical protein